ncbi:MAG: zinc dependent phospholipase C family protein [Firmicutes bacterium]|nr:zinc dependent phospholipase C family protein [Bacillota bacterium]
MPGFITHYICGEAVLNRLPPDIGKILSRRRQLYNIGTQGPDIFFFYLPGLLRKNSKNLGGEMHRSNFGGFVSAMLDEMGSGRYDGDMIFAYIAGFLTHYTLDYNAHPYVYYRSGFKVEGDGKRRLTHSVHHRTFETAIDVLMLNMMSGQKPADKKLWQLIRTEAPEAREIAKAMSAAVKIAYGREIPEKEVYRAIKYMVYITRLLQSRKGRRKKLMEFAEELTVGERVVSSLIHPQEADGRIDYLNIGKKPWGMPWDNTAAVESSFPELYDRAVEEAESLIEKTDLYRRGKLGKEELLEAVGNRSLLSGAEAGEAAEFLYHESVFA